LRARAGRYVDGVHRRARRHRCIRRDRPVPRTCRTRADSRAAAVRAGIAARGRGEAMSAAANTLRIATRQSRLALWQAEHVTARLRAAHPGLVVELVPMTTQGDRILDRTLAQVGGKGLFIKELEIAIAEGRADIAVHSMKDVPSDMPPGMTLAAMLSRADPHDAFVSLRYRSFSDLPQGARVGTS